VIEPGPASRQEGQSTKQSDFADFFSSEYASVARALLVLTGDESAAEELAEEAFTRAYERWDRIRGMDSPAGYVYRTAVNLHRNELRRRRMWRRNAGRALASSNAGADPDDQLEIRRAVAALPRGHREVLVLVDWLGYDAETSAQILGLKVGAVRTRLYRARAALRDGIGGVDE
jgi:RNA polymerase sigma factor (sigma-70 family)